MRTLKKKAIFKNNRIMMLFGEYFSNMNNNSGKIKIRNFRINLNVKFLKNKQKIFLNNKNLDKF